MEEIEQALLPFSPPAFLKVFVDTAGDRDKTSSLRPLEKTNFFTDAIDEALLKGEIDVAVHSAKDLPESLPVGLKIFALTKGLDPRDAIVTREGESFWTLPQGAIIATSSLHREEMVRKLREDLRFRDLRGTIDERLHLLEIGYADGIVVALAALIRLNLTHLPHLILEEETAPLQGKLAVVGREQDEELETLFRPLDSR
jgi:hydroxymethylbilane synthase